MPSPIRVGFSGPLNARVMVVGDCPDADSEWRLSPFSGRSGLELTKMLHEAGLLSTEIRFGYALPYRPDRSDISTCIDKVKSKATAKGLNHYAHGYYFNDALAEGVEALRLEIALVKPAIIIALGEIPLWALTSNTGITSWRGSLLELAPEMAPAECIQPIVLPTYAPASIQRVWEWRAIGVRDLSRVSAYLEEPEAYAFPQYQFAIRPSANTVLHTLGLLLGECDCGPFRLSVDIETIARHISCIGIAWTSRDALCIPLLDKGGVDYWSVDEEVAVYAALKALLTHPNCYVVGQNFAYDRQFFERYLGYSPNLRFDTMIAQHTLFPGLPKSLDFLASMYCHYYRYWKQMLKDFNQMPTDIHEYWTYNSLDCCITYEVSLQLESLIDKSNMREPFSFQMKMLGHVNRTMQRGVRVDLKRRGQVAGELLEAVASRQALIQSLVDFPLNINSPKQMKEFFYEELGLPPILNRKTKQPTCDDDALLKIAARQPLLKPLIELIQETRSLGVFLSTFCLMPLDTDNRMRTSYNVAGTETFRFNSSANVWGSGGNMQNLPKGNEK